MRRTAAARAQRGFVLLELVIAGLLVTLLAVWGSQAWMQRLRDSEAQSLAAWMLAARHVTQAYLDSHVGAMAETSLPGPLAAGAYQDWSSSEERSVGIECVSTCQYGWSRYH